MKFAFSRFEAWGEVLSRVLGKAFGGASSKVLGKVCQQSFKDHFAGKSGTEMSEVRQLGSCQARFEA